MCHVPTAIGQFRKGLIRQVIEEAKIEEDLQITQQAGPVNSRDVFRRLIAKAQ